LENTKKVVAEFERRVNTEVRRQEKLDMVEKKTSGEENYQRNIWQIYCITRIIKNLKMNI